MNYLATTLPLRGPGQIGFSRMSVGLGTVSAHAFFTRQTNAIATMAGVSSGKNSRSRFEMTTDIPSENRRETPSFSANGTVLKRIS
jgi:hypothetical protein